MVAEMHQTLLHELRVLNMAQAQAQAQSQAALLAEVQALRMAQERLASRPLQVTVPAQTPGEDTGEVKLLRGILRELVPLRQACEQAVHVIKGSASITDSAVPVSTHTQLLEEIQGLRQVCEMLATAIQTLSAQQKTLPASMLGAVQAFALSRPVSGDFATRPVSGDSRKKDVDGWSAADDNPVFIPSGLVDTTQAVSVESAQDSESGDVENSVARLRALKSGSSQR